jgi:hypothetical protein
MPLVLRVPDAHRSRRSALHHVHARDTVASIASHPNVRDDREPPLFSGWDARAYKSDLPDGLSEIFFARPLDRNSRPLPVGQITEVSCTPLTRYSTLMSRRFSYCGFAVTGSLIRHEIAAAAHKLILRWDGITALGAGHEIRAGDEPQNRQSSEMRRGAMTR